ncbi:GerMN domain-containing protein [Blastococcus sp. CCUG 61487]|uniref:GerMN domain-containing protein n=1 Tax=Blastococcus sp. CCUG 61487 TaxID=1840703 RepID=UPI001135A008|nr:GerMN domain-containing protein [Blastococcus sp. CCUG 61487]TKJ23389.1 hypothetical protein A6V29_05115 [Blastococcus sp. CCUG 61487]
MIRRGVVLALGLLLVGCGVPTGGAPSTIPSSDIPYGLAEPSAPSATTEPPDDLPDTSRVYLISPGDVLVPRGRELSGGSRRERLAELLDKLAEGPTPAERDQQLSSALPPEAGLSVGSVRDGVATVRITAPGQAPSGVAGRRSVAQIVLTATSVPGIRAVLLELNGERIEAPLPGGELTTDPLTAADFADVLVPSSPAPPPPEPVEPPVEPAD